jgi:two-component system response regulator AtoC
VVDSIVLDPAMVALYELVTQLAPAQLPVLITGETGTGKELVAAALHARSLRAQRPLVPLNCAALPESLAESTLFGHDRGAFSGAVTSRPGVLEAASGSTLFLDEVGELPLAIQAKLLRVLETQRVARVGEVLEREIDVRVVAATNRDLRVEVASGRFRSDLYFRLSAAVLHLPALRDRPYEIVPLARSFLNEARSRLGQPLLRLTVLAENRLRSRPWLGNIRELRNLMQYVAATAKDDEVTEEHINPPQGPPVKVPTKFRPLSEEIADLERVRIREALIETGGNQTRAAEVLSMPVRTFFGKAKLYGLTPKKAAP